MAKKSKVTPKKSKKPAGATVKKARAKAPPKRPSSRSSSKPGGNSRGGKFATFEEAKSAAIDSLIDSIEKAERRLSAVKRAGTLDELEQIAKGPLT